MMTSSNEELCTQFAFCLISCGLVTPYGDIDQGQHWLRFWLVVWQHQTITWTNIDLSLVMSCGINLRTLSWQNLKIPFSKSKLKIVLLKLHPVSCSVVGIDRFITCPAVLLHWHREDYTIVPVSVKPPWRIWVVIWIRLELIKTTSTIKRYIDCTNCNML